MGTGQIKGGSKYYRSIGQNILITSSKYPYENGRFGVNSPHTGNKTRNIFSEDNIATARDFYDKISFGGIIKTYEKNIIVTYMADGSIISLRLTSHSDGTPVVDINITGSSHTGGIKKQKIHFLKEDS